MSFQQATRRRPPSQKTELPVTPFRDEIADLMRAAGRGVETEVRKITPFGPRVVDIEVSNGGQILGGIETKLGIHGTFHHNAPRTGG